MVKRLMNDSDTIVERLLKIVQKSCKNRGTIL